MILCDRNFPEGYWRFLGVSVFAACRVIHKVSRARRSENDNSCQSQGTWPMSRGSFMMLGTWRIPSSLLWPLQCCVLSPLYTERKTLLTTLKLKTFHLTLLLPQTQEAMPNASSLFCFPPLDWKVFTQFGQ